VEQADSTRRRVAVLGGSAGSLEALTTILARLPAQPGFAVLVVLHLDADQRSQLDDVLRPLSVLPVERLTHLRKIEHDRVYVMPEGVNVTALDGHFRLTRRPPGLNLPIDICLASLAQDPDVTAAAVILSGSGQDGVAGIVDLKASGGLALAQTPPEATHESMPTAAINTGLIDEVLDASEIGEALLRRFGVGVPSDQNEESDESTDSIVEPLTSALAVIQQKTGTNLGYVKPVNLKRRFLRRVLLQKDRDVNGYLQLLRSVSGEAEALRSDILIGVTAFFRDTEFVAALTRTVIPKLLELKHDPLRIWVPACSTGEEVYTIAILLKEALAAEGLQRKVQIFGTDINESAIEIARSGRYSESIVESIPNEFVERAFSATSGGYLLNKDVREMCVFAHHNLLTHAPFSGMGLISCRNLLIYLRKEAQQHVFEVLHYACRPDGFLLLGRAEAPSASDGFEHAGAPHLYRRISGSKQRPFAIDALRQWGGDASLQRTPRGRDQSEILAEAASHCAAERYAPPGFVIDDRAEVVQFRGDVSGFIAPASGEATLALPRLLRPELNVSARTALIEARQSGQPVRRERLQIDDRRYALEVLPLKVSGERPHYLVTVQQQPGESLPAQVLPHGGAHLRVEDLERTVATLSDELEGAQTQLKTLIGDFEATSEELRTSNEEMLSANEELQSANEELHSAKQELEAANQELHSLNEELKSRNDQLARANDDLSNLVAGIPLPVIMVDRQLQLRRFSPQAAALLGVVNDNVGHPLAEVMQRFAIADIERSVHAAVHGLAGIEHEHIDSSGRWWLINVRAYRTTDDRIDGAVIAFQDVNELKQALEDAKAARTEAEHANSAKDDFLSLVSHELRAPLNVISGWASVLSASGATAIERLPKVIDTIKRHCQIQAQLIDDLLDVSRISSGQLALDMQPVDLCVCVRSVIHGMNPMAQAKDIQLVDSGLQRPQMVNGDGRRLQQIASNLLGNAIKFTPKGGRIEVAVTRMGSMIEMSVVDTGIGIAADRLPNLFSRFFNQSATSTRDYGGLGLGLSIVKHLVQGHGGTVTAHSEGEGRGSRLTVRLLALDLPGATPQASIASGDVRSQLNGLSILLVEDDPEGREALKQVLELAGAIVIAAGSAADALARLEMQRFDALVSDIAMPGMDGYDLLQTLRSKERTEGSRRTYAVALSGFASLKDRDAALVAGFDEHAPKPVDAVLLVEKLVLSRGR
jgi:two-component system CheB/CheR fusion protein